MCYFTDPLSSAPVPRAPRSETGADCPAGRVYGRRPEAPGVQQIVCIAGVRATVMHASRMLYRNAAALHKLASSLWHKLRTKGSRI